MKCPTCGNQTKNIKAKVIHNEYIEGCNSCLHRQHTAEFSAKYNRETMKRNHKKDLLQRFNPDGTINDEFIRAYPNESKQYFSQKELEQSDV